MQIHSHKYKNTKYTSETTSSLCCHWVNFEDRNCPTHCGFVTFLLVSAQLITLNLLDYCTIISGIKFWWFSFFWKPKTDLWKPRYHLIMKATLSPKSWWAEEEHLTFCIWIFSWLCIWYFCICVCICLCICLFVFLFVFVFICWWAAGMAVREWEEAAGAVDFWTKLESLLIKYDPLLQIILKILVQIWPIFCNQNRELPRQILQ